MLKKRNKLQLTEPEREKMRAAGRFNARLMDHLREHIQVGITTEEIDQLVYDFTMSHGHRPATLHYQNYPKSCCTSVNEVICHGIPNRYKLQDGDIVNVDVTSVVDGWHGDQSETFLVGEPSPIARAVAQCSFDCLWQAIEALRPNCRVSVIGQAIVEHAVSSGFSVVEEYVGHGLGRMFHQKPNIPHVPTDQARRDRLKPGMCFTIEPMINAGSADTELDDKDGWTVYTKDRSLSAQFEHTVLMTDNGPEVLTLTENGPQKGHKF